LCGGGYGVAAWCYVCLYAGYLVSSAAVGLYVEGEVVVGGFYHGDGDAEASVGVYACAVVGWYLVGDGDAGAVVECAVPCGYGEPVVTLVVYGACPGGYRGVAGGVVYGACPCGDCIVACRIGECSIPVCRCKPR